MTKILVAFVGVIKNLNVYQGVIVNIISSFTTIFTTSHCIL